MFNTIVFLLCHFVGDFSLQSDWMSKNKGSKTLPCLVHVLIYTFVFALFMTTSWKALLFIGATHFIFDRFTIILRRLIWLKNHFPCGYPPFKLCDSTGYYDDSPYNSYAPNKHTNKRYGKPRHKEITWWLYIITDNTVHLLCNFLALALFT